MADVPRLLQVGSLPDKMAPKHKRSIMLRRKEIFEAAIEGLEEQIRQKRAAIGQLRAELNGTVTPTPGGEGEQTAKAEIRKRRLSPARRAALVRNLAKARAARARKRAAKK
jgi:hypothetical protein